MRSALAGIIADQRGIFRRQQALESGYTPREFVRLTRPKTGIWIRIRYGVYAEREFWSQQSDVQRARLLDRAALLMCNETAVLSHSSAARFLKLPIYGVHAGLSHLTRSGLQTCGTEANVKHHRGPLQRYDVQEVDGCLVTTPLRTVLDMAREYGYRTGMVAADAALRTGCARDDLVARVEGLGPEPHLPTLAAVAGSADGRAETPIETLGRILLNNMGIVDLELQYTITYANGGHAEVDLYSRGLNHVFECDGRVKYQDQKDLQGQPITADDVVWREKKREDLVRGEGHGFSRIVWSDTIPDNFTRASNRLWREIKLQNGAHFLLPA